MIAAVVLAAGGAKRFGRQKLLEPVYCTPVVRRAVNAAIESGVDEIVVVTGADDERVRGALEGARVRCVTNANWNAGMGVSLSAGIAALSPETRAALIVLGDQPSVAPEAYTAVLDAYRTNGSPIVVPVYRDNARGHPVLFDAAIFPELRAITGDHGARAVIERDPRRVLEVALTLSAPRDVDTPDDVVTVMNLLHLIQ